MSNPEADKALGKAKITLMAAPDAVFFCTVMMALRHIWDDSQPTAYTNGRVIGYNEDFFMSSTQKEQVGLILHEVLHVALEHMIMILNPGLDKDRVNRAADYVINLMILDAGFHLPKGGLIDYKYKGLSTMQVYKLLEDEPPPPDYVGDVFPMEGDPKEAKEEIDAILIQAVMQSRMSNDKAGTVPGDVERYVDKMINPQLPWFRLLRSLMTKFAKEDYSLRRPNRRFMPKFYLPTLHSEAVCDIAVGMDVSGSVNDKQFDHMVSETGHILKQLKPERIDFIQFDTTLKPITVLKKFNDLGKVEFHGRGGTLIDPLMEWAKKNKPTVLIVFTDGEYRAPSIDPGVPVIWVIHGNTPFTPPFGQHVPFKFEE